MFYSTRAEIFKRTKGNEHMRDVSLGLGSVWGCLVYSGIILIIFWKYHHLHKSHLFENQHVFRLTSQSDIKLSQLITTNLHPQHTNRSDKNLKSKPKLL